MAVNHFLNGPTILQERLIKIMSDYLKNPPTDPKKRRSLGSIVTEAGYGKSVAANPNLVFRNPTVKKRLDNVLTELANKRNKALDHITDRKLADSSARDLAYITSELTKNHQLLSGGATERTDNTYDKNQITLIAQRALVINTNQTVDAGGANSDGGVPSPE